MTLCSMVSGENQSENYFAGNVQWDLRLLKLISPDFSRITFLNTSSYISLGPIPSRDFPYQYKSHQSFILVNPHILP